MKDESLQIGPYGLLVSIVEPPAAAVGVNVGDIELGRSSLLELRGGRSQAKKPTKQPDFQGTDGLPKPIN